MALERVESEETKWEKKKKSPIECLRSNTIGDCGSNLKAFLSVYK